MPTHRSSAKTRAAMSMPFSLSWRRRAALSAVVAAALHGNGKLVGPAEGRNEQGYQQGHQGFGLLEQVAGIEVGAAGLLSGHDLIRLSMRVGMKRKAMDIIMDSSCTGTWRVFSGPISFSRPSVSRMGEVV